MFDYNRVFCSTSTQTTRLKIKQCFSLFRWKLSQTKSFSLSSSECCKCTLAVKSWLSTCMYIITGKKIVAKAPKTTQSYKKRPKPTEKQRKNWPERQVWFFVGRRLLKFSQICLLIICKEIKYRCAGWRQSKQLVVREN